MGPGGPLPDLDDRRRPPARALVARGLQRPALDRAHRGAVALDAPRLAAVGHRLSAGAAWAARFRRLARDYERLPETLAGLHFLVFAILMLSRVVDVILHSA